VVGAEAGSTSNASAHRRILDAASRQIGRRGVHGFRVEQVARDVGVSVPLLYYHFDNRTTLVRAALERGMAAGLGGGAGAELGESGRQALTRFLLATLTQDTEIRLASVLRSEALAVAVFDETLQAGVRHQTQVWCRAIDDLIRYACEDGSVESSVDRELTARQLSALVDGVRERWLAEVIDLAAARAMVEGALTMLLPAGRRP
jgi:AcrR family transcriptional regulator